MTVRQIDTRLACERVLPPLDTPGGQYYIAAAQNDTALADEFGIFTVLRTGLATGACIRVTPALANRMTDLDRLADAVRRIARN
jgi:selenocysteine lyase/cysteine desulfurase